MKKKCVDCGQEVTGIHECQQTFSSADTTVETENGSDPKADQLEEMLDKSVLKSSSAIASLINKDTNERFALTQSVSKIGRDKSNTISLHTDSYVSRHHAWVLCIKGNFYVEDLGSTNGTVLNGEILSERKQIQPGDCIKLGRTELVFEMN
jgi:hypothetical protein